jgi:hypothetical protein
MQIYALDERLNLFRSDAVYIEQGNVRVSELTREERRARRQLRRDPTRRNVVEFRHASWWNDTVFAAFRQAGAIFCSCSGPKLPDELIRSADDVPKAAGS